MEIRHSLQPKGCWSSNLLASVDRYPFLVLYAILYIGDSSLTTNLQVC